MAQNIKLSIAKPNIEEVLEQFLNDKRKQLKPGTIRKYESIIDLFEHSLNSYAYQGLNKAESEMFDELYEAQGDAHREFVQIFGPEKIPDNIGEFLGYFMPRKVMCGKEMLKSAGTVLAEMLFEYADCHPVSGWADEIDDYLTVKKVEPGKIYFSNPDNAHGDAVVLALPKRITDKCKVDWQINLFLGKTKKGWQIIEVGQVYAM